MHIVIPVLGFGRAGGYRVLSKLADEWITNGHQVTFVAPADSTEPYFPTKASVRYVNCLGVPNNREGKVTAKSGGLYLLRRLWCLLIGLYRLDGRVDVIIANHNLTAPIVALAPASAAKVYYIQAYEPDAYSSQKRVGWQILFVNAWVSYLLPLHRVVNAPVYFKYANLRAHTFVPPGLDFDVFTNRVEPLIGDTGKTEKEWTIGVIGRDEPEKATKYAIAAFRLHEADYPKSRLLIAYGGGLKGTVPSSRQQIVVPRNDAELASFYRSLDILLAPGIGQHGAPYYPILEAFACGAAVITCDYLLADNSTAWIVPPKDSSTIAHAIQLIIANEAQRNSRRKAAYIRVRSLAWRIVAEKFQSVLVEVTDLHRGDTI